VIADMRRIFETGHRPPDQRTRELEPVATENGRYWRLRSVKEPLINPANMAHWRH
jgi:hypothetical protein